MYYSLISCFLDVLVTRRLILNRILNMHYCKLISWHVHLPDFWLKSINLIQTNFRWKKSILRFKIPVTETHPTRKKEPAVISLPSPKPHINNVHLTDSCCTDRENKNILICNFTYQNVHTSVKLIIM